MLSPAKKAWLPSRTWRRPSARRPYLVRVASTERLCTETFVDTSLSYKSLRKCFFIRATVRACLIYVGLRLPSASVTSRRWFDFRAISRHECQLWVWRPQFTPVDQVSISASISRPPPTTHMLAWESVNGGWVVDRAGCGVGMRLDACILELVFES